MFEKNPRHNAMTDALFDAILSLETGWPVEEDVMFS